MKEWRTEEWELHKECRGGSHPVDVYRCQPRKQEQYTREDDVSMQPQNICLIQLGVVMLLLTTKRS